MYGVISNANFILSTTTLFNHFYQAHPQLDSINVNALNNLRELEARRFEYTCVYTQLENISSGCIIAVPF